MPIKPVDQQKMAEVKLVQNTSSNIAEDHHNRMLKQSKQKATEKKDTNQPAPAPAKPDKGYEFVQFQYDNQGRVVSPNKSQGMLSQPEGNKEPVVVGPKHKKIDTKV